MFYCFNKQKIKKAAPIILLAIIIFLVLPWGTARAASIGSMIGSFFVSFLALIFYLFAMVTGFFMEIGGKLLSLSMTASFNKDLFIHAPFVQVAWGFTRDFANLFFILWMVIIALATILDFRGYQAKKLLPKLIGVAIAVNFSLVIAGFLLDIAQGLMGFLTQAVITIKGTPYSLAEGLVYAFRQSEIFGARLPSVGSFFGNFDASLSAAMHNLMVVMFGGVAAYVFVLLSVMLLVRVVALWVLLILAPLAWVIGIMPFGARASKEWWNRFFQWAFYGVTTAFFIYLAAMAVWAIQGSSWAKSNFGEANLLSGSQFGTSVSFLDNFESILSFLVVMVMLMLAKSMGMSASKKAGDVLTGAVGGFIAGKASSWGKKPIDWAKKRTKESVQYGTTQAKGAVGRRLMAKRLPVLSKAGTRWEIEARKAKEKKIGQFGDYSKLTDNQIMQIMERRMRQTTKGAEWSQIAKQMVNRGLTYKVKDKKHLAYMYDALAKSGNEADIKKFEAQRWDIIADPQKRKEALKKAVQSGEIKNWTKEFVDNLSSSIMRELAGNKDALKAITKASEDWSQEVKDSVLSKLQEAFSENFDTATPEGKQNIALRGTYAKMTGNYAKAFDIDSVKLQAMPLGQREKIVTESSRALADAVSKMKQKEWEKLNDSPENIKKIATYIQESQIANAGRVLSSKAKKEIYDEVARLAKEDPSRQSVYQKMQQNDLWPSNFENRGASQQKEEETKKNNQKTNNEESLQEPKTSEDKPSKPASESGIDKNDAGATGSAAIQAQDVTIHTQEPPRVTGKGAYVVDLTRSDIS